MKALLLATFLLAIVSLNSKAQSKTALSIVLDRQESQTQPNLPDSSFDVIGSFNISDTVNLSKLVVSIRENFQDTVSASSYLVIDTLSLSQSHPLLIRNGLAVSFSYAGILSMGIYFFQVDFFDYNQQHIGRTIKQF